MIPLTFIKSNLSHKSGVYIFKDSLGEVLYVGKAIDLYHRVSSYFRDGTSRDLKSRQLADRINEAETIIVESELEALILEANLIKRFRPPFNVVLRDDKDYLYIAVTKENFPKIITARKKDLGRIKKYWGPFPSARTTRDTLKSLRKVFPWCSADKPLRSHPKGYTSRSWRLCFYYHLGLCPGACAGEISQKGYNKIIARFAKFMNGKKEELVGELTKEMTQAANLQQFEEAAKIKKILIGIGYLTQPNRVSLYLENPNFLEEERKLSLEALQHDLGLEKVPARIEGYDISNTQGKEATGSMVVLTNGEIDKNQYRKFKIRIWGRPNDVGMMREMVRRRLMHLDWPLPDLVIVDGGRGQVRMAKYEILNTKYEIPVFGLAKRMEWLYPPEGDVVKLPKRSLSLKLLQKLRDEAHRFAISYHRKLREKAILGY